MKTAIYRFFFHAFVTCCLLLAAFHYLGGGRIAFNMPIGNARPAMHAARASMDDMTQKQVAAQLDGIHIDAPEQGAATQDEIGQFLKAKGLH